LEAWRQLDLEYDDPFMNMAVEEAIPRMVGQRIAPCTLRFWRNQNAVVLGNFQSVNLEVNRNGCWRYGAQIVRRFTGGGAVYHDHGNLNYAISIPKDHRLVPPTDPMDAFRRFSEGALQSIKSLGLLPVLKPPNNIEVNQKKVHGGAGAIRWGAVFYHSSTLVCSNLNILSHVLRSEDYAATRFIKSSRRPVTTISKELDRSLTTNEFSDTLVRCFGRMYGVQFFQGTLMKNEKRLADELYGKYSSDQHNFKI
jgi:lipoate-protein ligase A